eukprot:c2929_g1_i1.p1 GENE.c2929_g1_i1~~c2929_g1_i1.p1  ORF type:complete len:820 (-),score=112.18 c2929_g1_i1:87-2546(-)
MDPSSFGFSHLDSPTILNSALRYLPISTSPSPAAFSPESPTLSSFSPSLASPQPYPNLTFSIPTVYRDATISSQQAFDPQPQIFQPSKLTLSASWLPKDTPVQSQSPEATRSVSTVLPRTSSNSGFEFYCERFSILPECQAPTQSSKPSRELKKLFLLRSLIRYITIPILCAYCTSEQSCVDTQRKRKTTDSPSMTFEVEAKRCCVETQTPRITPCNNEELNSKEFVMACRDAVLLFLEAATARVVVSRPTPASVDRVLSEVVHETVKDIPQHEVYESLEMQLDGLLNTCPANPRLDPNSCALGLLPSTSATSDSEEEVAEESPHNSYQDKFVLMIIEELKFCIDNLHARLIDSSSRESSDLMLFRLLMSLLFTIVCHRSSSLNLLDRQEHRLTRNWVMSAFFRAILRPVVSSTWTDILILCKIGLARLDAKQKKIPRDVVEQILRPALLQFCDISKLDMRVVIGLHSIVELFPTLFKEVFGKKILDILDCFLDQDSVRLKFGPATCDQTICKMIACLLDFFRLFASTQAFPCDQWIGALSKLVLNLEKKWSPDTFMSFVPAKSCNNFRAPLCRFLSMNTEGSVSFIMENSADKAMSDFFSSILKCRHAISLKLALQHRASLFMTSSCSNSFVLSPKFSDVQLMTSSGEGVPSHRVVLSSKSEFFRNLFGCGMAESFRENVLIEDMDVTTLRLLVQYLYDQSLDLAKLSSEALMDLLVAADRFVVDDLVNLCEHMLCARVCVTNCFNLIDLVVSRFTLPEPKVLLSPLSCGDCPGESIIKVCQSTILGNLGSLSENADLTSDRLVVDMLTSGHALLIAV